MYEQPDKRNSFAPRDHPDWLNKLFLFWPENVETVNFVQDNGVVEPTEIVTADVAIIDLADPENPGRSVFIQGARIGGKGLVPQLYKKLGKKVLGRLTQSPSQGQKSGAYYVLDFTPADAQLAEQYETAFPHTAFQQPSGTAPQSAQQPVWPPQGAAGPPPAWAPQGAPATWPPQQSAPAAATAPPWPAGLSDFLKSRGIDVAGMDEAVALQIASTLT